MTIICTGCGVKNPDPHTFDHDGGTYCNQCYAKRRGLEYPEDFIGGFQEMTTESKKERELLRVWPTKMVPHEDHEWVNVDFEDEHGEVAFTLKLHRDDVRLNLPYNAVVRLMVLDPKESASGL